MRLKSFFEDFTKIVSSESTLRAAPIRCVRLGRVNNLCSVILGSTLLFFAFEILASFNIFLTFCPSTRNHLNFFFIFHLNIINLILTKFFIFWISWIIWGFLPLKSLCKISCFQTLLSYFQMSFFAKLNIKKASFWIYKLTIHFLFCKNSLTYFCHFNQSLLALLFIKDYNSHYISKFIKRSE